MRPEHVNLFRTVISTDPRGAGGLVSQAAFAVRLDRAAIQAQRLAGDRRRQSVRALLQERTHSGSPVHTRSSIDKALFKRSAQS